MSVKIKCYACDGTAIGFIERRYDSLNMPPVLAVACERHADPKLPRFHLEDEIGAMSPEDDAKAEELLRAGAPLERIARAFEKLETTVRGSAVVQGKTLEVVDLLVHEVSKIAHALESMESRQ